LELYNVGWIVAHSNVSRQYFDSMPGIVPLDVFREVKTYKVDRSLSFFVSGVGRIVGRSHNRLVLTDLIGDEVVLRYHYYLGLKSEPCATLVPTYFLDDPNPFIKIVNPPNQVLLYFKLHQTRSQGHPENLTTFEAIS